MIDNKKIIKRNYYDLFKGVGMVMNVWGNKTNQYSYITRNQYEAYEKTNLSLYHDMKSISNDLRKVILLHGKWGKAKRNY